MKVYIQYIYFPNEKLHHFIKNDSNNENWPKGNTYLKILTKEFGSVIKAQKSVVDEYRDYLTKRQRKGDDSFLIRVKNEINNKIKILRDPDFKELEPAIRKRELNDLTSAREIYERFFKFDGSWADTKKIEGTDLILTCEKLREWNDDRDYPIKAVNDLLDDWEEDIAKTDDDFEKLEELRSYEIEVLERTKDTITFIWRVPKNKELDAIIFPEIKNNLFFFYGEFFEVQDWEQTNIDTVEVIAEISIFYNYYWHVIKSSGNGILHHSPLAKSEICSCPEYDIATNFYSFASTYKLKMGLYKITKDILTTGSYIETKELPIVAPLNLWHVEDPKKEVAGVGQGFFKQLWETLWTSTVGTMYFNLSSRLGNYAYAEQWHHTPIEGVNYDGGTSIAIGWKKINGATGSPEGGEDIAKTLGIFDLDKPVMYHFLRNHIKATLYWRQKQFWQGNYWLLHNGFQVWETVNPAGTSINIYGNNRIIGKLTESITMKIGGNAFVNKFFEVIVDTALTDEKGTQNRQTERNVVSDTRTKSGAHTHKVEKTKSSAVSPVGKGKPNIGSTFLRPSLYSVDHTKAEYTGYQFLHRWVLSGVYPLQLIIEFNQDLLNQYRNRKELKGKPSYDYFNALTFGDILNVSGFCQMSIISWNTVPYADWFREKLEGGIYIYDTDPQEFYKKKIKSPLNIASSGGTTRGGFNIITLGTRLKGGIGRDNAVNVDNMSWVWKSNYHRPSYCRPADGGRDIFPDLITGGTHTGNIKINDTYAWKFDGYSYGSNSAQIPKGIKYSWSLQGYSTGASDKCDFTGMDEDGKIAIHQRGAEWELEFIGNFLVERKIGNPEGVPPQNDPGVSPTDPFDKDPEPMGTAIPNPIPMSGTPDPFGGGLGGDPELEPPDPEGEKEPDPEPEKEPEPEPEPEHEPEPEPEPEKPDEDPEYS